MNNERNTRAPISNSCRVLVCGVMLFAMTTPLSAQSISDPAVAAVAPASQSPRDLRPPSVGYTFEPMADKVPLVAETPLTPPTQSALIAPQLKHDGTPIVGSSAPRNGPLPFPIVEPVATTIEAANDLATGVGNGVAQVSHAEPIPNHEPAATMPPISIVPTSANVPASAEGRYAAEVPVYVPGAPDQQFVPPAASPASSPDYLVEAPLVGSDSGSSSELNSETAPWSKLTEWAEPEQVESTVRTVGLLTVISLAPAILLMTTSFIRISVVLGLLRQAIGTQMLPSNQIVTSLAMFLTALVMMPVWQQVYDQSIKPYTDQDSPMTAQEAWDVGIQPVRTFMSNQIELADNSKDVLLFHSYLPDSSQPPETYEDVPLQVLLPAFMISELKIAFLIGFQIYLPFLIIDLVVSSVTVSMGMMMLPPATVSLPLKLLLFVLVDGWHLVVGMLLQSFGGFS